MVVQVKGEAEEINVDQDFGAGFDEAAGGNSGQAQAEDKSVEPQDEADKEPTSEEKSGTEESAGAEASAGESDDKGDSEKSEEDTDIAADDDREKVIHKQKTLRGMYNSENKKRRDVETERDQLRAELEKLKSAPAKSEKEDQDEEENEGTDEGKTSKKGAQEVSEYEEDADYKNFKSEWPEIEKGVDKRFSHMEAKFDRMIEALAAVTHSTTEMRSSSHESAILQAHPDFKKHVDSGEVEEWILSQPYKEAVELGKAYNDGNAQQVIELFDKFKKAKGYATITDEDLSEDDADSEDAEAKKKLAAMAGTIKSKNQPVAASRKDGSKNDFDGGFEAGAAG